MDINYQIIGERIRAIRKQRNISQQLLAELIGKTPTYISRLECGSRGATLETLIDIINTLHVSADSLLAEHLWHRGELLSRDYTTPLDRCNERQRRIVVKTISCMVDAMLKEDNRSQ